MTPENIWLREDLSCQFPPHTPQNHRCLIPALHLELLSGGCWKPAAHDLILVEVDDKYPWEVPICSWHLLLSWSQVGSHQKELTLSDSMSCLAQLLPTSPRSPGEMGLPSSVADQS